MPDPEYRLHVREHAEADWTEIPVPDVGWGDPCARMFAEVYLSLSTPGAAVRLDRITYPWKRAAHAYRTIVLWTMSEGELTIELRPDAPAPVMPQLPPVLRARTMIEAGPPDLLAGDLEIGVAS